MEDGFEVVCQQVVLLLPLFRDHPLCSPTKCIQISFCTGADELSQQLAVRHSSYAAFMSNLAASSVEQGYRRRLPMDLRSAQPSVAA